MQRTSEPHDGTPSILKYILSPGNAVFLALLLLLQATTTDVRARSPNEFAYFRRACVVLQVEADALSKDAEQAVNVERALNELVRKQLSEFGLNYPVDQGSNCYPKNVARHTTELAFIFHVTLRRDPQGEARTMGALIFHHQFENFMRPPHQYPTVLFECDAKRALYPCVRDQAKVYFDQHVVPEIEIGTGRKRGGKK